MRPFKTNYLHMKSSIVIFFILACATLMQAQPLTAVQVINKADDKMRGESSQGEMTMTIVRPKYTRTISMKTWSKGEDYSMVYITAPAKEKGQVFLKRKMEMWNWVPSIERMVKIPPSMMMQSWMGSDYTNDDLVKQSSLVTDYTHKLLASEKIREQECYKVELTAKPDAAVVWGKILLWVTKSGYDIWQATYYDEEGELIHTEHAYDIKKMGDRLMPTRIEIVPADKPGNKTVITFVTMLFNKPISESFFTQQNMKQVK